MTELPANIATMHVWTVLRWGQSRLLQLRAVLLQAANGVDPGAHISIKSTSELMRVTLAYAAMQSMFRAMRQWRDLHAAGSDEAYRRQLAAADAASVHTHVTNALGVAAEMQLDFGDHV